MEFFGEGGSGGGFIPYGFIVIAKIFWYFVFILIVCFAIKGVFKLAFKLGRNIVLILLTVIVVYNINLFLFNNVIDKEDFDGDGLSNYYEEQVCTNKFKKNNETREYEIDKIDLKNNPIVKDVVRSAPSIRTPRSSSSRRLRCAASTRRRTAWSSASSLRRPDQTTEKSSVHRRTLLRPSTKYC